MQIGTAGVAAVRLMALFFAAEALSLVGFQISFPGAFDPTWRGWVPAGGFALAAVLLWVSAQQIIRALLSGWPLPDGPATRLTGRVALWAAVPLLGVFLLASGLPHTATNLAELSALITPDPFLSTEQVSQSLRAILSNLAGNLSIVSMGLILVISPSVADALDRRHGAALAAPGEPNSRVMLPRQSPARGRETQ